MTTAGVGDYYVVATDSHKAEMRLKEMLDLADYGFTKDRKVSMIEVVSEEIGEFPEGKPNFSSGNNLIL